MADGAYISLEDFHVASGRMQEQEKLGINMGIPVETGRAKSVQDTSRR